MIILENVYKTFDEGKTFSVKNLNLTIKTGETLVILGSSGCGKTTTLKMINALIKPTRGKIYIDKKDLDDFDPVILRRNIGYVFQKIGLFPHLTVAENVAIVLRLIKMPKDKRIARARELLDFVNLNPERYANRYPQELSGGQQQRVGVARALANKPEYLLMDEPFGALDSITRDSLQEDLIRLKNALNKTVIFVTHDVFEAIRIADRIAIMHRGELQQVGNQYEIINNPANSFVRDLFLKPAEQIDRYKEHKDEEDS